MIIKTHTVSVTVDSLREHRAHHGAVSAVSACKVETD